jgi:AraC-like DNA-binding protein
VLGTERAERLSRASTTNSAALPSRAQVWREDLQTLSESDPVTEGTTARAADTHLWTPAKEFNDFAVVCCGRPHVNLLTDPAEFSLTQRVGRMGQVAVSEIALGADMSMDAGELCGAYRIVIPLSGRIEGLYRGSSLTTEPGVASVYPPEGRAAGRWIAGSRLISLKIDRPAIDDALSDALGRQVMSQPDFAPVMSINAAATRSWISMVALLKEQLFLPDTVLNQPMVGLPFVDSLVRGFLFAAEHPHRDALLDERLGAPRAIRTAAGIIEEEADLPLTLTSIAARCHVSVRSLQQGFRRHLGTSPMAYLREVRLRRAHQTLLTSDPSAVTVASVAYHWGFSNLGRFAAVHAARYGKTPNEALRAVGKRTEARGRIVWRRTGFDDGEPDFEAGNFARPTQ